MEAGEDTDLWLVKLFFTRTNHWNNLSGYASREQGKVFYSWNSRTEGRVDWRFEETRLGVEIRLNSVIRILKAALSPRTLYFLGSSPVKPLSQTF
ncbi:hypothetical protein AVEN_13009-1 [Araneus ventricosus]|uniref:Uncharacterized protein n=1 Tax=Araneus ventricosus TaxID=182803 RepID=A0A4Y2HMU3_ARAVE|nr:hypothetical protein AVEN_13009-1 [Araneus ventricosus]